MRNWIGLIGLALDAGGGARRRGHPADAGRRSVHGQRRRAGLRHPIRPGGDGAANGPHYYKTNQIAVLTGCTDGQPNCALAKSKKLIGMEVISVDGQDLRPETGRVRQILDAFANQAAGRTVLLELYARGSNNQSVKVSFARR